jgi:hypothetical protein
MDLRKIANLIPFVNLGEVEGAVKAVPRKVYLKGVKGGLSKFYNKKAVAQFRADLARDEEILGAADFKTRVDELTYFTHLAELRLQGVSHTAFPGEVFTEAQELLYKELVAEVDRIGNLVATKFRRVGLSSTYASRMRSVSDEVSRQQALVKTLL